MDAGGPLQPVKMTCLYTGAYQFYDFRTPLLGDHLLGKFVQQVNSIPTLEVSHERREARFRKR